MKMTIVVPFIVQFEMKNEEGQFAICLSQLNEFFSNRCSHFRQTIFSYSNSRILLFNIFLEEISNILYPIIQRIEIRTSDGCRERIFSTNEQKRKEKKRKEKKNSSILFLPLKGSMTMFDKYKRK